MRAGLDRLCECLIEWCDEVMRPHLDEFISKPKKQRLKEALSREPLVDSAPALTPEEHFILATFYELTEVLDTLEALKDTEVYIARFPYSRTRVSKGRYLAHQVSIYLHEIHILRLRLVRLTAVVKNGMSNLGAGKLAQERIGPLFKMIRLSFDGVSATRGSHVHARRYSDPGLRSLSTLDLVSRFKQSAAPVLDETYKDVRFLWLCRCRESIATVERLLDRHADTVWECLFAQGRLFDLSKLPEEKGSAKG